VRPDWCPGINLGNARSHRIVELCCTRHVQETPLLREIAERGPAALLPLAERFGITPQSAYASKCHLCFDLRRQLVHHMPEEFGPRQVYEVCGSVLPPVPDPPARRVSSVRRAAPGRSLV